MTIDGKPLPSFLDATETRTQYGALCWRRAKNGVEVLLITSRDTGRWVIPKGWPIKGLSPEATAAREAWEEAGAEGETDSHCLGLYSYDKGLGPANGPQRQVPCIVAVYSLHVRDLADRFPEVKQRQRKWFPPHKAARKVAEPELQALLAGLDQWPDSRTDA
ncbi:MAG: NUDIX hydrolase [Gemmobacter sp.]|nr:NUDIX hydrolase [Gemmobacter sp.]